MDKFFHFRVISQGNKGLSETRNVLIDNAESDFIWFVDADDEITKDSLNIIKNDLEYASSQADLFLYGVFSKVGEQVTKYGIVDYVFTEQYGDNIAHINRTVTDIKECPELLLCYPSNCWCVFRKSLITDNNLRYPQGIWYEDLSMKLRLLAAAKNIFINIAPIYIYKNDLQSIMHTEDLSKNLDIIVALETMYAYCKKKGLTPEMMKYIEAACISQITLSAYQRIWKINPQAQELKQITKWLNEKYPNWRRNRVIRRLPWKRRLLARLNGENISFLNRFA